MQFSAKLTQEDVQDLAKLVRPKGHWWRVAVESWYPIAMLLVLSWATILGLLGKTTPNWRAVGVIWVVIAAIFAWSFYRVRQERATELTQLHATFPDTITFTATGIALDGPGGAKTFLPWAQFKSWREGGRVVVIDHATLDSFVALSIADLSEHERQAFRHFLDSQIHRAIR